MSEQDPTPAPARPAPVRPRSRIARLTGRHATEYSPLLEPLMRTVRQRATKTELADIDSAIAVAAMDPARGDELTRLIDRQS